MSNNTDIQPQTPTELPVDVDVSRHEQEYVLQKEDVLPIAQFFNQVGGDLSSIEKHNVDGPRALKLDKDKVLPPTVRGQPMVSQQHVPNNQQSVMSTQMTAPTITPGVTLKDLEHIQKIEKKLTATNRKVVSLDKRVSTVESVVNVTKKRIKYKVETDQVQCTTTSADILIQTICDQIANGAQTITINKC